MAIQDLRLSSGLSEAVRESCALHVRSIHAFGVTMFVKGVVHSLKKGGRVSVVIGKPCKISAAACRQQSVGVLDWADIAGVVDEADSSIANAKHLSCQFLPRIVIADDHLEVAKRLLQDGLQTFPEHPTSIIRRHAN